jgi:Tfp pilus assembly PilM family ATPase/Tfp pilus assembly protein PilN
MMRSLFFPERIGSYVLFAQRIVACEITKTHIQAAVVKVKGNNRTIEKVVEKAIENNTGLGYAERAALALQSMLAEIGSYHELHVVVACNQVVFKELTVPFISERKIKLILPFEIEPLLPFALHDASIDCVITKQAEASSVVFAAAIKNDQLNEHLEIFNKAKVKLDKVTVDMFELFALYKAVYSTKNQSGNHVLMYMGLHTTRIAIVSHGQLRAVRFLNQGIIKLAKTINEDVEHILKVGINLDRPDLMDIADPFFGDIKLTLEAIVEKMLGGEPVQQVVLMGMAVDIKNMHELIERSLHITCTWLGTHTILQAGIAGFKENHRLANTNIISIASALSFELTQDFNLNKVTAEQREIRVFKHQLIAAVAIMATTLLFILGYNFYAMSRFKQEINASEREAIALLKTKIPALAKRPLGSLDTARRTAQAEVDREKTIWFALSPQSRASFLLYLQELFTRIDADGLGLIVTRLTLNEDSMLIEGSVKNYEALNRFEEDLRQSKLFINVPRLEELKFSAKIGLSKNYGD